MRKYNIMETAKLLNVNEETVRRWIRTNELKATLTSKKSGYVIDQLDLFEFIRAKPKYKQTICVNEREVDNPYLDMLEDLLNDLIIKRDLLNEYIDRIQTLLEEF